MRTESHAVWVPHVVSIRNASTIEAVQSSLIYTRLLTTLTPIQVSTTAHILNDLSQNCINIIIACIHKRCMLADSGRPSQKGKVDRISVKTDRLVGWLVFNGTVSTNHAIGE